MAFRLTPQKQPRLTENHVEKACKDLLGYRGWYVIRLQSGLFRTMDGKRVVTIGKPGLPDYVVIHRQYPAFLLETKRPGAGASPDQQKVIWEFTHAYRIAVATIDRVEALIPWLNDHTTVRGLHETTSAKPSEASASGTGSEHRSVLCPGCGRVIVAGDCDLLP